MFELVNKAKKNNKGFSLVELIVVILIIAVIAVALAPQVMKYVGQSRENVSANTAATIKSATQAAVAEYQGQTGAGEIAEDSYTVAAADSKVAQVTSKKDANPAPAGGKTLMALIQENVGNDKIDVAYTITIAKDSGQVTVAPSSAS